MDCQHQAPWAHWRDADKMSFRNEWKLLPCQEPGYREVVNVKELSLVSPSKCLLWLFVQPCYLSEIECQVLVWNVLTDVIEPLNVAHWKIIPSLKAAETKPKRCAVKDAFSDTNLSIEEDVLAPSSLFKEQWSCGSCCHVRKFCLSCQSP